MEIVRLPRVSAWDPVRRRFRRSVPLRALTESDDRPQDSELTQTDETPFTDNARSNAEILFWQARLRVDIALLVLVIALGAWAVGFSSGVPWVLLTTVTVYVAVVGAISLVVYLRQRAGQGLLALTVVADILLVVGSTFLVVPPQYYDRMLILSFAILHLTEFYFGRALAWGALGTIGALYVAMIHMAIAAGDPLSREQELLSLGIFLIAAGAFLLHYGTFKARLARMAQLLERAAAGDFTAAYAADTDARPDAITMVGRSYDRVRAQLGDMVLSDPLSRCLNRRGLEQQLERELSRSVREGSEIALIALDIDYFKRINDTFGHLAGDVVVRELGRLLREVARAGDVVARLGGDEFAVLLPATGAAGAFKVATRLRERVAQHEFMAEGKRMPVTISVGLVSMRVHDVNIAHDLFSCADEALYAAKDAGRNRVSVWTSNLRILALARAGQQVAGR